MAVTRATSNQQVDLPVDELISSITGTHLMSREVWTASSGATHGCFDLDRKLISDYERFARSFTEIRARDIREQVDQIYASNKFWPDPLIGINPHFEAGDDVEHLATKGCSALKPVTCSGSRGFRSSCTATSQRRSRRPKLERVSSSQRERAPASHCVSLCRSSIILFGAGWRGRSTERRLLSSTR